MGFWGVVGAIIVAVLILCFFYAFSMLCLMKDGTAVLNGRQCLFVFE